MVQPFSAGDRLGRYELVEIVGGGGFASVWRAKTVGLGGFERDVAIKVIRPGRAKEKRFQDMLLDEARLVARIHHPNVTQIWEVGEDPRSLYIVMELVEGESLDELRFRAEEAGKTLSIGALFRVLADVCAGLHVAHELAQGGAPLGLVHRDISPQNILVSRHGIAKLIDFGIAKAKERLIADTTTGYIKGKISFMAPEQARAEDMDRRADVWAIGAVAYEILEGRPPCEGATDVARLVALIAPTKVLPLSRQVPEPLRRVVEKALEKDRDARYPTALSLKEAIEEALVESELETSASDVATLFGAYFRAPARHTDARPPEPSTESSTAEEVHSVERAVSSTILVDPGLGRQTEIAEQPSAIIALPMRRRWPLAVAALAVVIPSGAWFMSTRGEGEPSTPTNASAPMVALPPPPVSVVSVDPTTTAAGKASPLDATLTETAGASSAPRLNQASASASVVQRPRAGARPGSPASVRSAPNQPTSAPKPDENAIE